MNLILFSEYDVGCIADIIWLPWVRNLDDWILNIRAIKYMRKELGIRYCRSIDKRIYS